MDPYCEWSIAASSNAMKTFNFGVSLNHQTLNWWQARAVNIRHLLISVTRSLQLLLHPAPIWSYQFYFKWMKQSQCLFVKCLQSCKMSWWDVMVPAGTVISEISATLSWLSSHGYWSSPTLQQLTMSRALSARPLIGSCISSGIIIGWLIVPVSTAVYQCHQIFTNISSMSLSRTWASQTLFWAQWISNVHSYGAWLIRIVPIVDIWQ